MEFSLKLHLNWENKIQPTSWQHFSSEGKATCKMRKIGANKKGAKLRVGFALRLSKNYTTVLLYLCKHKWFLFYRGAMKINTIGSEDVYFVAPSKYLGDQRFAYTFTLSFQLQQDNASFPAASSRGDVILEGRWFNQPLVTRLSGPPPGGNSYRKYEVRVMEESST